MRTSRRSGGPLIARQIFDAIRTLNRQELIVEQKLAHRGFIMANGLIRLSGTGSELLQRLEIRALPIWKADGEVSLSCGTTPLRVVPVHGPIPRYVAILRWTQISFIRLLWLWAHVRRWGVM